MKEFLQIKDPDVSKTETKELLLMKDPTRGHKYAGWHRPLAHLCGRSAAGLLLFCRNMDMDQCRCSKEKQNFA
jgi:hypothetical protein